MGLSFEAAKQIHSLIQRDEPESRIFAANALLYTNGHKEKCQSVETADDILRNVLRYELDTDNYLVAATLCWGTELFDYRPRSVKLIWNAMQKHPQVLIFGSGSQGKSYSAIAFGLLDWERDPEGVGIACGLCFPFSFYFVAAK